MAATTLASILLLTVLVLVDSERIFQRWQPLRISQAPSTLIQRGYNNNPYAARYTRLPRRNYQRYTAPPTTDPQMKDLLTIILYRLGHLQATVDAINASITEMDTSPGSRLASIGSITQPIPVAIDAGEDEEEDDASVPLITRKILTEDDGDDCGDVEDDDKGCAVEKPAKIKKQKVTRKGFPKMDYNKPPPPSMNGNYRSVKRPSKSKSTTTTATTSTTTSAPPTTAAATTAAENNDNADNKSEFADILAEMGKDDSSSTTEQPKQFTIDASKLPVIKSD